mgnify:CR=1 FL=1
MTAPHVDGLNLGVVLDLVRRAVLEQTAVVHDGHAIDHSQRNVEIMRRSEAPIEMPLWQSEPAVNAHILDLYTYLAARSEGKIGVERPSHK